MVDHHQWKGVIPKKVVVVVTVATAAMVVAVGTVEAKILQTTQVEGQ